MVGVSASVNLPLQHKVQKFSSDTGSPGWSRKKGRKTVVCKLSRMVLANDNLINSKVVHKVEHTFYINICSFMVLSV